MKKVLYAILICIIIAGIVVIATIGLRADIIYSKNVQLDVFIGQTFNREDIETIVAEVFPNERTLVQKIEMFGDMVSITLPDTRSEEELNSKVEELNTKINEKYGIENETDSITITHNPKIKLSSLIFPYLLPIGISMAIILVYVGVRYKKLGVVKTIARYVLTIGAAELLLLSLLAITRFPINRAVIPVALLLLVMVLVILGFSSEKRLAKMNLEEKS